MSVFGVSIYWIILGVIILWFIWTYNRLVSLRFRVKEALSDIDVQLKRRTDLIPNIINSVKGYIAHERGVLEKVTEARAKVVSGGNPIERNKDENYLSQTLKALFAVAENYPDLKANVNFLELQRELSDTENKIQAARRFYNSTVQDINTAVQSFPINIIALIFRFGEEKFFELEEEGERAVPEVKF
ncbi:MAG: LemA family protein [Candidatus Paceibacteria bacterium]